MADTILEIKVGLDENHKQYHCGFTNFSDKYFSLLKEGHGRILIEQLEKAKKEILNDMLTVNREAK
jgi:hypothetical protein